MDLAILTRATTTLRPKLFTPIENSLCGSKTMQFSIPVYLSIMMRIIPSQRFRMADQGRSTAVLGSTEYDLATEHYSYSTSSPQLQNHVNGSPSCNIIAFQRFVVCQLLATVDKFDLVYLDALLFL